MSSNLVYSDYIVLKEKSGQPSVRSGYGYLWAKTDGSLQYTDDGKTDIQITSSGGTPSISACTQSDWVLTISEKPRNGVVYPIGLYGIQYIKPTGFKFNDGDELTLVFAQNGSNVYSSSNYTVSNEYPIRFNEPVTTPWVLSYANSNAIYRLRLSFIGMGFVEINRDDLRFTVEQTPIAVGGSNVWAFSASSSASDYVYSFQITSAMKWMIVKCWGCGGDDGLYGGNGGYSLSRVNIGGQVGRYVHVMRGFGVGYSHHTYLLGGPGGGGASFVTIGDAPTFSSSLNTFVCIGGGGGGGYSPNLYYGGHGCSGIVYGGGGNGTYATANGGANGVGGTGTTENGNNLDISVSILGSSLGVNGYGSSGGGGGYGGGGTRLDGGGASGGAGGSFGGLLQTYTASDKTDLTNYYVSHCPNVATGDSTSLNHGAVVIRVYGDP